MSYPPNQQNPNSGGFVAGYGYPAPQPYGYPAGAPSYPPQAVGGQQPIGFAVTLGTDGMQGGPGAVTLSQSSSMPYPRVPHQSGGVQQNYFPPMPTSYPVSTVPQMQQCGYPSANPGSFYSPVVGGVAGYYPPVGASAVYAGPNTGAADYNLTSQHQAVDQFRGTVKPVPAFNANSDAEVLRKAMKGFGCDDRAITNVLCFRSNSQRQQIKVAFKTMYGKDLIKELVDELKGHFEAVILALMLLPEEYDAEQLHKAMAGVGTNEATLIEILATRKNAQIHAIKLAFKRMFGKDLEHTLQTETSGHFKRLLTSLSVGGRDESGAVNSQKAMQDARNLYEAGVKRWGTDESMFNAILCSQNAAQLRLVFDEYKKIAGQDIETTIRNEFSSDIENGLLVVARAARSCPEFFAERLYHSMKGMGTRDEMLIRCVVSRCEADMVQIKQEFQRKFGQSLEQFISSDVSGAYKSALIALVQGN